MAIKMPPEILVIDGEPTPVPAGAVGWKQTDAVEDACWLFDEAEAEAIDHDDPGVVLWTPSHRWHLN
jgi:hypothetical protein